MGLVQYRNYADSNQIKKATNGNNEDFFLAMIRRPSMTDNGDGKKQRVENQIRAYEGIATCVMKKQVKKKI